jgi:antibiotic biosynthesis monooxygenase (ABM) superfamily enzyme
MNAETNQAPAKPAVPNRHKLALLVLVTVYPLITGILSVLGPLTAGWQVWQRTLVLAPVMVVVLVYFLIPFLNKRFRKFLTS